MNFKSLHTTIGGDPVCQLFNQTLEQLDLSPDTRFETFNQKSFEPQNSSC